jgi:hypothetical protein
MVEAEAAKGHDVGDIGTAIAVRETSLSFGPAVSSTVPPISAPPIVLCEEGHIALPFVERSTKYVTLPLLPLLLGLLIVFA